MEQLAEKLGWKRVAIILIFVSFIFFGVIAFSMIIGDTPSVSRTNRGEIPIPTVYQSSGSSQNNLQNQQVYIGDSFEVSYPDEFLLSEGVNGTNKSILFENAQDQKIQIQEYNAASIPLSNILNFFRGLGYPEQRILVAGENGYRFAGLQGPLREDAVIFEKNGRVYKIQLIYISQPKDLRVEQIFSDMVSSFTLQ